MVLQCFSMALNGLKSFRPWFRGLSTSFGAHLRLSCKAKCQDWFPGWTVELQKTTGLSPLLSQMAGAARQAV